MKQSPLLRTLLCAALAAGLASPLAGCGPAKMPTLPLIVPMAHPPYRAPLEVGDCTEESTQFAQTLAQGELRWLATGLVLAVRENSGPISLIVSYADAAPMVPESTPLAVTLPAIDAYPDAPKLEPAPTKTGQPWKDAQLTQQTQQRNQAKVDAYNAGVDQVSHQMRAVRDVAEQASSALTALRPPQSLVSDKPSLWGCVSQMSHRFQAVGGEKVLVLATTANERSFADVSQLEGLKGVRIIVAFYQCIGTASWCDWSKGTWQRVFAQAQVASQTWLDAGQSRVTSPLVVFDPQAAQTAQISSGT